MQNPRRCWSWGAGHWGPALRSTSHCSHTLHRRLAGGQGWRRRAPGGERCRRLGDKAGGAGPWEGEVQAAGAQGWRRRAPAGPPPLSWWITG